MGVRSQDRNLKFKIQRRKRGILIDKISIKQFLAPAERHVNNAKVKTQE